MRAGRQHWQGDRMAAGKGVFGMRMIAVLGLLVLAGCGADGAPSAGGTPGVTVSGEVAAGVVVNPAYIEGQ